MRLAYVTTKSFPASTADHIYIRELSKGFVGVTDFQLIVRQAGNDLSDIPHVEYEKHGSSPAISSRTLGIASFLWKAVKSGGMSGSDQWFMANDLNILVILAAVRKFRRASFKICFDCHMLTDTWRDKIAVSSSDKIITTSNRLKEVVVGRFPGSAQKIQVVYGAFDASVFASLERESKEEIRRRLNLPVNQKLIGYVGRFKTIGMPKGLDTMIASLKHLPDNFTCAFVGGTPAELEEYCSIAEKAGLSSRCLFIEQQAYEAIPAYEAAMDALAIPYPDLPHYADYGFPMKAYEYIASGIPIIYSRLAILDEVLVEKGTSFIPSDPKSFAEAALVAVKTAPAQGKFPDEWSWKGKAEAIVKFLQSASVPA